MSVCYNDSGSVNGKRGPVEVEEKETPREEEIGKHIQIPEEKTALAGQYQATPITPKIHVLT